METIETIPDYCKHTNIPLPRYPYFDVRRFEENMPTVNATQPPFRHEFYAVAMKYSGKSKIVNGMELRESSLFFNSPYQVISWEIKPDWTGWYIIFDKNFLSRNPSWRNFIIDFPFFRLDQTLEMNLSDYDTDFADHLFHKMHEEYQGENQDKFLFIQSYTQLLLLLTKRYFEKVDLQDAPGTENRTNDIILTSRFQTLLETTLPTEENSPALRQPSFYADKLNIHPNHLNAVVKRITGNTASKVIQTELMQLAKSLLQQTELSIKEVAYKLHFTEPTHFNSFFKKMTGITPNKYRSDSII